MAIKYLVINHPQDATIKTVYAYDTPPGTPGAGYLNFTNSDGQNTTSDTTLASINQQVVSVPYSYGGASGFIAPTSSDFQLFTGATFVSGLPSWVTVGPTIQSNTMTNQFNGTAVLTFTVSSNAGNTARSLNIDYIGDASHASQIAGHTRITITQPGDVANQGKSERRLKYNIELVGESAMGIPMYHFNYKDETNGKGRFIGTMVDDLQRLGFEDVLIHTEKDILVDYNKIDVPFHTITN